MGDDATLLAGRLGLRDDALTDAAFTAEYPFAHRFAKIAGWNMHYFDTASDGSDGEPVVMVHGNPTWSYFYRTLAKRLAADGFRCLAMDHIGCGLSDKPQKYPYTLDRHIDNLDEWLAQALPGGEAFNLVVHDWGGPIGMGLALRHPERVRRVVVLNTSAFALGAMPRRITICRVPWLGALLVRGLNAFAGGAAKMTTVKPLPEAVARGFVLPYNNWANRVAVHRFVQDIPLTGREPSAARFADTDARLASALAGKPMLIQWGMRDWCFTPYFLGLWKKAFPSAEADEYGNAGHYLLEDAGESIAARVGAFLRRP